jgi:hypothetical protein
LPKRIFPDIGDDKVRPGPSQVKGSERCVRRFSDDARAVRINILMEVVLYA